MEAETGEIFHSSKKKRQLRLSSSEDDEINEELNTPQKRRHSIEVIRQHCRQT